MNRSWKAFTIIVSSLLATIIVCVTINVSINKITSNVLSTPTDNNQQGSNVQVDPNNYVDPNQQGAPNGDVNVDVNNDPTNADSNPVTQPNVPQGNGNQQQNNNQPTQASGDNPMNYDKAQIVSYYNNCLRKTYSQPKFTVTKTEVIDVQLGEMKLNGKPATNLQGMANKVVASNAAKGGTKTQSFTNKNAVVDAKARFILPSNLYPAAVKSYNVSRNGAGYVINFTLNAESCDFTKKPPYNYSCTFPLDFTEIDLGGLGSITSAQFNYPGTTLTATIDGQGRVVKTYVVMPLYVNNAAGQGMGQTLTMDISGKWLCTNVNTF